MIPSDHFVRFYNEVFKYLDKRGELNDFYMEISRHQEFHCLEMTRENGIRGIYDYYQVIRKEENCDMDIELYDDHIMLRMNKCPSLSKAVNNDAGVCPKYCLHCPGWVFPLYTKVGLYDVYDLYSTDEPRCAEYIFEQREAAQAFYDKYATEHPDRMIVKNF